MLEIVKNTAEIVRLPITDGWLLASGTPSAAIIDSSNNTLATVSGSVILPGSAGTCTIATVIDAVTFTLDDVAKVVEGGYLAYYPSTDIPSGSSEAHFLPLVVRVAKIVDETITIEEPVGRTVEAGDIFTRCEVTATIPASATATASLWNRIEWSVPVTEVPGEAGGTFASGDAITRTYSQSFHIVRQRFASYQSSDVLRYMDQNYPGAASSYPPGWFRRLAESASNRVRQSIMASGNYPHMMGDPSAFDQAHTLALRMELGSIGLTPPGWDPAMYSEQTQSLYREAVRMALGSTWIDKDDDGAVSATESPRPVYSTRLVRA